MEQITQDTIDSLTESAKEVDQFTKYFQGKMPGLLDFGIKLLIVAVVFFVCSKLIKFVLRILERSFERADMEAASAHFTLSIVKAVLYLVLAAIMATFLGVSGASVAALLGSMGVGVVLALKESLSNIAGGFILLFMKPFVSGDYIHEDTNGNEGTVVKIDLFYTTLLTVDNRTVSIPNGIITNSSLTNISRQDKRQLREQVAISYRNDIKQAKEVLFEILQKDAAILQGENMEVVVEKLGDSGIILGWHAWVEPQNYFPAKWRIAEEIKYQFDAHGIEIPYQQIEVFVRGK